MFRRFLDLSTGGYFPPPPCTSSTPLTAYTGFPRQDEVSTLAISNPKIDARGRKRLRPRGKKFYDEPDKIVNVIHNIIHGYYDGPWKTFTEVPTTVKDQWWSEFESKYYWECSDGPQIQRNWGKQCNKHISGTFADHRRRNTKPKWISSENWAKMLEYWEENEGFQSLSETNKKNRASEGQDGGSNYAGGAKSTVAYSIEHEKEHSRAITFEELLKKTYTKKSGEFSGERAEKCLGHLQELKRQWLERYGSISKEEEKKLHMIASGGEKKEYVFALGSEHCKDRQVLNPPALHPDQPLPTLLQPSLVTLAATSPTCPPSLQPASSSLFSQFIQLTSSPLGPAQAPTPPPPPMPLVGCSSTISSSIHMEKLRRLQEAYKKEARRIEIEMSQSSSPEVSFQSLMNCDEVSFQSYMNSSMPSLMNSLPPSSAEFNRQG